MNPVSDLQLGTKQHRWVEGAWRGRKVGTGPNQPGWRRNFCLVGNQGLDSISHTSTFPAVCGGGSRLLRGWWHLSSGRSTSDCSCRIQQLTRAFPHALPVDTTCQGVLNEFAPSAYTAPGHTLQRPIVTASTSSRSGGFWLSTAEWLLKSDIIFIHTYTHIYT